MDTEQDSAMFDVRIATALVAGPVVAVALYSYAQPLLLPALVAAMIGQLVLPTSRPVSRRRMAVIAGLLGFNLLGFGLLMTAAFDPGLG